MFLEKNSKTSWNIKSECWITEHEPMKASMSLTVIIEFCFFFRFNSCWSRLRPKLGLKRYWHFCVLLNKNGFVVKSFQFDVHHFGF